MSDHQETLKQVVARIEASFVKIESYGKKVDNFPIAEDRDCAIEPCTTRVRVFPVRTAIMVPTISGGAAQSTPPSAALEY